MQFYYNLLVYSGKCRIYWICQKVGFQNSQTSITVKERCNDRCSWVCIHRTLCACLISMIRRAKRQGIHTAWVSALLVLAVMGNAKASNGRTGNSHWLHAFRVYQAYS